MRAAFRFAFLYFCLHPLQGQTWFRETDDGARVIVETRVTCDLPGVTITIPLGMPIRAAAEVKDGGETFYLGYPDMAPNSRCRVYGPSTAVWHKAEPDSLPLAILDHALARKDATFEDLIAAENYLIATDAKWKTQAGRDQISGKLQFRWLQLISRAVGLEGFHEDQPLIQSWKLSHGDLIESFDPTAEWFVPTRNFWHVYESNQTAPWAEELVWFVANLR
jgi:hypothetical protein